MEVSEPVAWFPWNKRTALADSAGNQTPAPAGSATRAWGRPYPAGKEKAVLVKGTGTGTAPIVTGGGTVPCGERCESPATLSPAALTAARTSAPTTVRRC